MDELIDSLKQINAPLRLFVKTPPLPEYPAGPDTRWYYPFGEGFDYTINDGVETEHNPLD